MVIFVLAAGIAIAGLVLLLQGQLIAGIVLLMVGCVAAPAGYAAVQGHSLDEHRPKGAS